MSSKEIIDLFKIYKINDNVFICQIFTNKERKKYKIFLVDEIRILKIESIDKIIEYLDYEDFPTDEVVNVNEKIKYINDFLTKVSKQKKISEEMNINYEKNKFLNNYYAYLKNEKISSNRVLNKISLDEEHLINKIADDDLLNNYRNSRR